MDDARHPRDIDAVADDDEVVALLRLLDATAPVSADKTVLLESPRSPRAGFHAHRLDRWLMVAIVCPGRRNARLAAHWAQKAVATCRRCRRPHARDVILIKDIRHAKRGAP